MAIEVNIEDYSKETMDRLSLLLASIPTDIFQVRSMKIIQQAFLNDGREKEFEFLISSTFIKMQKFSETQKESKVDKNKPVIKPTDLI